MKRICGRLARFRGAPDHTNGPVGGNLGANWGFMAPDATLGAPLDAKLGAAPDATLGAPPDATLGSPAEALAGKPVRARPGRRGDPGPRTRIAG